MLIRFTIRLVYENMINMFLLSTFMYILLSVLLKMVNVCLTKRASVSSEDILWTQIAADIIID